DFRRTAKEQGTNHCESTSAKDNARPPCFCGHQSVQRGREVLLSKRTQKHHVKSQFFLFDPFFVRTGSRRAIFEARRTSWSQRRVVQRPFARQDPAGHIAQRSS